MSDLDPDVFAILYRNLVENALRHGADGTPIHVSLTNDGVLTVANDGPIVPGDVLARLTDRFERVGKLRDGSGLGLAIVQAIAQRTDSALVLRSPRPGQGSGFEACLTLPTTKGDNNLLIDPGSRFGNSPS
jgi:two-component system OmpR family sensor kinase